jgi:putative hydrolase of the HAD superfamily
MERILKYKAVFFDLYGTLVDIHTDETRPALWRGMVSFFEEGGISYSPNDLMQTYFDFCRDEEQLLLEKAQSEGCPGRSVEIDILNVFRRLLKQEPGRAMDTGYSSPEQLAAGEFRRLSTTHIRLYAGALELLQSLRNKGTGVYLLSNAQRAFTEPELKMLGIYDSFDDVFISSDYGIKKPDPDFFRLPLKKYGLEASDCLMVGNDLRCDIEGAGLAGIDSCFILSALSPEEDRRIMASDASAENIRSSGFCRSGLIYCQNGMGLKMLRRALDVLL